MSDTAAVFRDLHLGPDVLLLANAWDAGSARLFESLGARAIATTSAGLAWSCGHPDGDALPTERLVEAVRSIARVLRVPLSIDVEAGYSNDPGKVADLVASLADVGAVGINLEDGVSPPELLAAKIERIKRSRSHVFVNARTDVYLRGLVEGGKVAECVRRARLFRESGADGLFVPKVLDEADIRAIASATELPLNVLAWQGLPSLAELRALGVRRLSAGSGIAQSAITQATISARAFLRDGALPPVSGGPTYAELNALFR
ncbi:MAG: isocitrate lyase/PEP mutase family protein [Polyangiales bacterium]